RKRLLGQTERDSEVKGKSFMASQNKRAEEGVSAAETASLTSKTNPKRVVMTGATSGLGAYALRQLVAQPDIRVIVGARGTGSEGVETLPLDLASLASVRTFAE